MAKGTRIGGPHPKKTGTFSASHKVSGMGNIGGGARGGPINTPFVSRVVTGKGR